MPDRSRRPRPRHKRLDGRASDSPAASDRPVEAPPEASPPLGDDFVRRPASLDLWLLSAAGLVLLGFALRAFSLGNQPLSPGESANALQSLAYYRGEGVDASAGPLFVYGEALIFLLFGASDSSARLLSAIAGTVLVALPLLLGRELGRLGARFACFLLAVSPALVYLSRQADAAMIAAALAFGAICLYEVSLRESSRRALFGAVVALALLTTAGPLGYFALASVGLYFLLGAMGVRPSPTESKVRPGESGPLALPSALRAAVSPARLLLAVAAVWLVATTGLVGDLHGVQSGIVDGVAGWLRSLVEPSGRSPFYYFGVLASDGQAPLLFGILGIVALRRDAYASRLTFWALATLLLGSLSASRPIGLTAQITIPLAVLAGAYVDRFWRSLRDPEARFGLLPFALVATVILAGFGIALGVFSNPNPPVTEALLAVPILLATSALAFSVVRVGAGRTWRHLLVVALVVAVLWGWRENSLLSYQVPANAVDPLVETATSPDIRQLASDVAEIGDAIAINQRERGVLVSPELAPTVRWYLRDTPLVKVGETPSGNTTIMVLPLEAGPPMGYVGERYRLGTSADVSPDSWKSLWRWYAYREAPNAGRSSDAMVYVKSIG